MKVGQRVLVPVSRIVGYNARHNYGSFWEATVVSIGAKQNAGHWFWKKETEGIIVGFAYDYHFVPLDEAFPSPEKEEEVIKEAGSP